jgi:hypothetical protein
MAEAMSGPIKQVGYSPYICTASDGSQKLVQIFVDLDTGLISSVQTCEREDKWTSWGPPTHYERA